MPLRSIRRRAISLTLLLAVLACVFMPLAAVAESPRVDTYDKDNPQYLNDDDLVGQAALVMDAETGEVLFDKNGTRRTYPASTTKIMTCLIALEHCALSDVVTIPPEADKVPTDSSRVPVHAGEQMSMGDLLYGMMMNSGNDAAVAVAMHVSGTISEFAELMNQRAREIGMRDTHFVNPHGYHDEELYSTAYDLALLAREAMQNRDFRDIVSAKSYTMAATSLREKKRLETRNPMFVASSKYYYPDLVGVKTGYHSKAGQCFVGAAVKDGVTLISVVLRSQDSPKWVDTARLLDYGITRYETLTFEQLIDRAQLYASVKNAALDDVGSGMLKLAVVPGTELDRFYVRVLPKYEQDALERFTSGLNIQYLHELKAPIYEGDILGKLTMELDGQSVSATIVAGRSVEAEPEPFTLRSLFPGIADVINGNVLAIAGGVLALIIIIAILLRIRAAIRDRRRRREMLRRRRAAYDRYRSG